MGLDKPFKAAQETEKEHFRTIHTAKAKAEMEQVTEKITDHVEEELEDTVPRQVQQIWKNLNLHSTHRFQRAGDDMKVKEVRDEFSSILS